MRQSKLFTKTRKEAPTDEVSKNAQLLIRGGFVHKEMAGVYSYLPLGLRVLNKIENIIREEMNAIGGQEIQMATLHPSENWKKTGGWDNVDVLFKLQSRTEKEYALGQSEEEIVTPIVQEYANSYKDLPVAVYQIGQKYRDELRAKSGIMRGREFGMKDMYSFHTTQEDFDTFYETAKKAYLKIFKRAGLDAKVTEASGGSFSEKLSYEFMVLTSAGEDDILYCEECTHCANVEVSKVPEGNDCPKCGKGKLKKGRASEVGNVFDLGQKYPKSFEYTYADQNGEQQTPIVGCYGIGTTRLMGTVVETLANDQGIIWPESIAPYAVHLLSLGEDEAVLKEADKIYETLAKNNIEVLFDDRVGMSAGEKFADADLLGMPLRAVVSQRSIKENGIELKKRTEEKGKIVSIDELLELLKPI
ncbi:MAG TPA: aminoacyl--tRNA ligase-related protein [Candidatus Paceibacterota bacterium]|jgi:prolyl-tRNA synthetase|nr:aminoacyl--tRNA ligase-related protein [Candidatus Paceibacterota bacterium]